MTNNELEDAPVLKEPQRTDFEKPERKQQLEYF